MLVTTEKNYFDASNLIDCCKITVPDPLKLIDCFKLIVILKMKKQTNLKNGQNIQVCKLSAWMLYKCISATLKVYKLPSYRKKRLENACVN